MKGEATGQSAVAVPACPSSVLRFRNIHMVAGRASTGLSMATAAKVLDRTRFESRARIADVFALGAVVIVGAALVFDMYTLGYTAAEAASKGGAAIIERDRAFVRMVMEGFLAAVALCWIAYRLVTAGARRPGG